jgi:hypothetical protein
VSVPDSATPGDVYKHTVDVSATEPESYPIDNRTAHLARVVAGSPAELELESDDASITACTGAATTFRARLADGHGHPVTDGTSVSWSTSLGELSAPSSETDDGVALVELKAGRKSGEALVIATAGAASDSQVVIVEPGPPVALALSAEPLAVGWGGDVVITANVLDGCSNEVADGWPIELEAERGSFNDGSRRVVLTTSGSRVTARLYVGAEPGPLRVTAYYGAELGETVVAVLDQREIPKSYLPLTYR